MSWKHLKPKSKSDFASVFMGWVGLGWILPLPKSKFDIVSIYLGWVKLGYSMIFNLTQVLVEFYQNLVELLKAPATQIKIGFVSVSVSYVGLS